MSEFPSISIFDSYRTYKSGTEDKDTAKARIGLYTFRFYDDKSGATVQRDICGVVELTWEIHRQEFAERGPDVFADKRDPDARRQTQGYEPGESPDDLKKLIGELTVQNDILKKSRGLLGK